MAVGQALGRLGASHQVLVVTHLPQVASAAHAQIGVAKKQGRERTSTTITVLDDEAARHRAVADVERPARQRGRSRARPRAAVGERPGERDVSVAPFGADGVPVISGIVRLDRRTKNLIPRLRPGDIAVIDHADLDRVAAEGLVEARVGAVVNVASSMTGRYPNVGPLVVAAAGIPLIDQTDATVFDRLEEGQWASVAGDDVVLAGTTVAHGQRLDLERGVGAARGLAPRPWAASSSGSRENTLEYLRLEQHLLLDSPDLPDVPVDFEGRQVLLVVRGTDYREDLAMLRSSGYLSDMKPVLIGVDGGADALLEAGSKPDVIIGDFDSVSDAALHCGASLVVHAYADGNAPGAARLDALGLPYTRFLAAGTSEDIAMLLAFEKGAELIVAVGTHNSMVEFLDKGRPRDGVDLPGADEGGPDPGRRQGREPALPQPGPQARPAAHGRRRAPGARDHHPHQRTHPPVPAKLLARLALTSRESRS